MLCSFIGCGIFGKQSGHVDDISGANQYITT
jgi:hypothetical protein